MQQTCLALGAASIGTLYLSWADGSMGQGGALVAICLALGLVSVAAVPVSRALHR